MCPGVAGAGCPADVKHAAGTACTDDGNPCTTDTCDGTSDACQHPAGNAGAVCRHGSGDVCDPDETCTGSSATCPSDVVRSSAFVCRAAAGECDQVETCPGIAGQACPADQKKASHTACTEDTNPCTLDECDGTHDTCQHPAGNAGAECRPAAGPCDVAEMCDGTSTACPEDAKQPAGTECRAAAGDCDVAATCDGSGDVCPANTFKPATTTCRPAVDECDAAEFCTGTSAHCPTDGKQPPGTVCIDDGNPCSLDQCDGTHDACQHPAGNGGALCYAGSGDVCDPDQFCTGLSTTCPAPMTEPITLMCRPSAGECDPAEFCPGVAGAPCPPDAKAPAATACADDGNPCSLDQCDGTHDVCQHPAGNTGAVCYPGSGDGCDPAHYCPGASTTCPRPTPAPRTVVRRPA